MTKRGNALREARGAILLASLCLLYTGYKIIERNISDKTVLQLLEDQAPVEQEAALLFEFDPNTVELPDLMRLGLSKAAAVSIIRYREYGKVFRIKEDLFTCYGVSDSLYYCLEPYIVIADTFRLKRRDEYASYNGNNYSRRRSERELLPLSEFMADTVGVNYMVATGALTRAQAEVFVKWRDLTGIHNMEELRDCYVVSDSIASMLEPYIIFTLPPQEGVAESGLIDLNKADSALLRRVYGIGEKSVVAILDYRKLLGGFYSAEQLSDLKVVTESNYEKIIQQILCDSCDISKIDVNFASAKTMKSHPYITDKALRRLLKIRELKGGWSTVKEMIDDKILTEEEATRVRPYLLFEEFTPRNVRSEELLLDTNFQES